jgi:hypothetical protein
LRSQSGDAEDASGELIPVELFGLPTAVSEQDRHQPFGVRRGGAA